MRKRSIPFSAGIRKCLAAGKTIVAGEKASACPRLLCLLILLLFFACDDPVENPVSAAGRLQTVPVVLSVELAEETDGAAQSPVATAVALTGRAAGTTALESELLPAVRTKTTTAVPDKLYTLDIYQYTAAGVYLTYASLGDKEIGERFTTQLSDNGGNDCQLLVIARGSGGAVGSLQGKSLADVRKITANAAILQTIGVLDGTNIAQMPYLLYLPKVKISGGKIISPEATGASAATTGSDVRLRLRRLAAGLTLDWKFSRSLIDAGYSLTEVRLMQIPANYYILPARERADLYGEMYPSSVSGFTDGLRLTGAELAAAGGTFTRWIPANARGVRSDVTQPVYRNKTYAHPSATYAEFVVSNEAREERLLYRVYLGANTTTDFNLVENTNYHWKVRINSADYARDFRIQYQSLKAVVSTNLVATSNCVMLLPGGNLCFNPYKHEAGEGGWNTWLAPGGVIQPDKTIDHVRVLWQTKDAGTSGDLVLGYVIDDTRHENLAHLTDGPDVDKARIHLSAPASEGGNAVVAAYNASGTVVWSWHIWVTDYQPVPLGGTITSVNRRQAIEAAQQASRHGTVQVYGGTSWTSSDGAFYDKVIMDRNLGATRAGLQTNLLDGVRTFGLLYQGGRKDPFFCSADGTSSETKTIYDGYGKEVAIDKKKPTAYGYSVRSYTATIERPLTFYIYAQTSSEYPNAFKDVPDPWGGTSNKTLYDPCPQGWRVPANEYMLQSKNAELSMMAGFGSTASDWVPEALYPVSSANLQYYDGEKLRPFGSGNVAQSDVVGSGYIYTGASGDAMSVDRITDKSAFFPGVSLRELDTGAYRTSEGGVPIKNNTIYLWSSSFSNVDNQLYIYQFQSSKLYFQHGIPRSYGFSVRCIQDRSVR